MTKSYQESMAKRMNKKILGMMPFLYENMPYPKSKPMQTDNILKNKASIIVPYSSSRIR